MKIRTGFISNSSSASFVIRFESNLPEDTIDKYITESDIWLKKRWFATKKEKLNFSWLKKGKKGKPKKEKKPVYEPCETEKSKNLTKDGNTYGLTLDTVMFNDWADVSGYRFVWALSENRIKDIDLIEIRQTEEEYSDCDDIVAFAAEPWELLERNFDLKDEEEKMQEAKKEYADRKYSLLYYLNNIGQEIKPEEHLGFIKDCLMYGIPSSYIPYDEKKL
jgi:hypothetical protein